MSGLLGRAHVAQVGSLVALLAALALAAAGPAHAMPCDTCDPGGGGGGTVTHTVTFVTSGPGSITSGPTVLCGPNATCTKDYPEGSAPTFSAAASAGNSFFGWSGACSGTGTCSPVIDADKTVHASFGDNTPPGPPTITAPTAGQVIQSTSGGSTSVTFTNGGDASTASYVCTVDGGASAGCSSPWHTADLSTGTHTVEVRAKDASNNISAPASRTFKVVNLPDTTLGGTPGDGATATSGATAFTYSSPTGTSYECTLDGASVPCTANLAVGDGPHTLSVRAGISPFGDGVVYSDSTPATRSWTVTTPAPSAPAPAAPQSTPAPSTPAPPAASDPSPVVATTAAPALPKVAAKITAAFARAGRATRVTALRVTGVPAGGRVELHCHGSGCPFSVKVAQATRGTADAGAMLRKARLRKGAVLEIRVSAPGRTTQIVRYAARPPKAPLRTVV